MYISEVRLKGYCNFKDTKIPLHDGVNIIIGSNNSGKSNLLKAIALTLNVEGHRKIDIFDLFCEINLESLKQHSPYAKITLMITQSKDELATSEESGLLGNYMNKVEPPYEAQLNFQYLLSADQEENYISEVTNMESHTEIWQTIRRNFSRFYEVYRWGGSGHTDRHNMSELFEKCDFQFLDAIRDVGRDMFMGYNPLLKDVLNFFVDYDLKTDSSKDEEEIKEALRESSQKFREKAEPLMNNLFERLETGKNLLLNYATDIGASFNNAAPDFSGYLSESELFAVLKLIIRYESGVEIPATHNGLGYNNLIYMSLLLAKMQAAADGNFMHRQAKLFSLLAIEEPEAHLHPAMQYQFLKFLEKNRSQHNVKQIIVTTHSSQIVSAVTVDELICLHTLEYGMVQAGYPRMIFSNSKEDSISKNFVQRYLDATRSDMFFANKLIFVEGLAEELLMKVFAKYLGYDLTKEHVLVVNMGGRYFHHFLKMFDSNKDYSINKKLACLTDIDPTCDSEACYPFEFNMDLNKVYRHHADQEMVTYASHPNIHYFRQGETYGKTLEYDLILSNPHCHRLITDSVSNKEELKFLMGSSNLQEMFGKLRSSQENERIKQSLTSCQWSEEEKEKALIASRYLSSISKGCNALELNLILEDNLMLPNGDKNKFDFNVPTYIDSALKWLFQ
ncbi:MAG: AAA family ATPase [Prevotella sp.]|jgi:putative ATP-dependent endonuclease of OLD family|nr:AAA family ATPase [Prevotella sp.]MBP8037914.1 AAA family ATPase [Prevotella sp.]MBP8686668.1 AAA family ATPase [Prevotella sp.]MCI1732502.1 AAA family ATPase [Prevotella sp.]